MKAENAGRAFPSAALQKNWPFTGLFHRNPLAFKGRCGEWVLGNEQDPARKEPLMGNEKAASRSVGGEVAEAVRSRNAADLGPLWRVVGNGPRQALRENFLT